VIAGDVLAGEHWTTPFGMATCWAVCIVTVEDSAPAMAG